MIKTTRRRVLQSLGLGALATTAAWPAVSMAQAYPAYPIRLINPFAPGGSADIISRLISKGLAQALNGNVIVENVGGAGGAIGSDRVAKSPPDGYTLLLSNVASQAIAATLYSNLSYDILKDFDHIALIGAFPNVLLVGPAVKAQSLAELIELAKAKPGSLTFGSAGNGSTPHLCGEMLNERAGIKTTHVPFKGAGPALVAVMAGEISFQFENMSTAIRQVHGGKLRALAVTSAQRMPVIPEVPTMEEQGIKDFVVASWYGLSAPAHTSNDITNRLAKAVTQILAEPSLRKQLEGIGLTLSTIRPDEYTHFIAGEITRWSAVIKRSNAHVT